MEDAVTAMIVTTDGQVQVRQLRLENEQVGLATLQALVDGLIEVIEGDGWHAYCNEEGKLDGLPINHVATDVASAHGWLGAGFDVLNGDVVFFGPVVVTEDRDILDDVPVKLVNYAKMVSP